MLALAPASNAAAAIPGRAITKGAEAFENEDSPPTPKPAAAPPAASRVNENTAVPPPPTAAAAVPPPALGRRATDGDAANVLRRHARDQSSLEEEAAAFVGEPPLRRGASEPLATGTRRLSSVQRRRRLDDLRQSRSGGAHGALWDAHAAGLAVTPLASRRSVAIRRRTSVAIAAAEANRRRSNAAGVGGRRMSRAAAAAGGGGFGGGGGGGRITSMADAAALVSAEDLLSDDDDEEEVDGYNFPQVLPPPTLRAGALRGSLRSSLKVPSFAVSEEPTGGGARRQSSNGRLVVSFGGVDAPSDPLRNIPESTSKADEEQSTLDKASKLSSEKDSAAAFKEIATRRASRNSYDGEGIELLSCEGLIPEEESSTTHHEDEHAKPRRDSECASTAATSASALLPDGSETGHDSSVSLTMRRASRNVYHGEGVELSVEDDNTHLTSKSADDDDTSPVVFPEEISRDFCRRPSADISVASFDEMDFRFASVRDLTGDRMIEQSLKMSLSDDALDLAATLEGYAADESGRDSPMNPRRSSVDMRKCLQTTLSGRALKFLCLRSSLHASSRMAFSALDGLDLDQADDDDAGSFLVLGTSADDADCEPRVLSPPIMESLQSSLPFAVSRDNFWLKYSLVRDGASLEVLLDAVRGNKSAVLAVETVDGEVFGSFTSAPWRRARGYFGNGQSFLWKMNGKRDAGAGASGGVAQSVIDLALQESDVEVYPWSGENDVVQMCTRDRIAVGGGTSDADDNTANHVEGDASLDKDETTVASSLAGFGIAIESDLLSGTSSPCVTFNSPPLSDSHRDGSPFEILNVEVWALTPCISTEEAKKLESSMLFVESNTN